MWGLWAAGTKTHLHPLGTGANGRPTWKSTENEKAGLEEHTGDVTKLFTKQHCLRTKQAGPYLTDSIFLFSYSISKDMNILQTMGRALEPVKPLVFVVICQNPSWVKEGEAADRMRWAWSGPGSVAFLYSSSEMTKLGVLGVPKGGDIYLTKRHKVFTSRVCLAGDHCWECGGLSG